MDYILVDLRSTQYSSESEIIAEIKEVEKLPKTPETERALMRLRSYLDGSILQPQF